MIFFLFGTHERIDRYKIYLQTIQYKEQGNLAFTLLVKSQLLERPFDFDELMRYSLTPVPYSLGTPDDFFNKTNKDVTRYFLAKQVKPEDETCPTASFFFLYRMEMHYFILLLIFLLLLEK